MSHKIFKQESEVLYRQSFERFCDDYAIDILKYLCFEDKIKLLCVSKQFMRCLPVKQRKMLCWNRYFRYKSVLKGLYDGDRFNHVALESILRRFPYINHIDVEGYCGYNEYTVFELITELCHKIEHFRFNFQWTLPVQFKQFMRKHRRTLKYIRISTNPPINIKSIKSDKYYWHWTCRSMNLKYHS